MQSYLRREPLNPLLLSLEFEVLRENIYTAKYTRSIGEPHERCEVWERPTGIHRAPRNGLCHLFMIVGPNIDTQMHTALGLVHVEGIDKGFI